MAITEAYAGTATISTTEYSLPANSTSLATVTDDGVFQLMLDLNALTNSDDFELKMYEKCLSSSSKRLFSYTYLRGTYAEPIMVFPCVILMHGWDMTLRRLNGSDRSILWSIRQLG